MMPGMPERRTHDHIGNGSTGLFATFNIGDGTVISGPPTPPPRERPSA
jgi:hypothetical protein